MLSNEKLKIHWKLDEKKPTNKDADPIIIDKKDESRIKSSFTLQ